MKRTKASDIRNPEHYFNKWLACEKKNYHKKQEIIEENESSMNVMTEIKIGEAELCTNKKGELFALTEASDPEFAWIELFENEHLYDEIQKLSKKNKMILTLRCKYRMPFADIAYELDISESSAQVNFSRIICRLKKIFL